MNNPQNSIPLNVQVVKILFLARDVVSYVNEKQLRNFLIGYLH